MHYLLKDKNIVLYLIYLFLFGLYPIIPIMGLYFLARNFSYADIGIFFAVFSLSGFLAEIPTGYLGDKYGRKLSVILGLITLTICAYAWTILSTVLGFSIFAALWMVGLAFISGSFEGYIYDYLKSHKKEEEYDRLLSLSGTMTYASGAIGSILGAYLFSLNIYYPYYLLAILFLLCIPVVLLMEKEDKLSSEDYSDELKVFSGMKYIFNNKALLWLALYISLLFGLFSYFRGSVDKPYILDLGLFGVEWIGVFVAISMLLQAIFMSQFAKIKAKIGDKALINLFWLMSSIPLLFMSLFSGFIGLLAMTCYYLTESLQESLVNSFCQKHIPSKIRATTLSSIKVYVNIGGAVIGLIAGILFDIYSIRTGLMIAFLFSLITYIVFLYIRNKNRSILTVWN